MLAFEQTNPMSTTTSAIRPCSYCGGTHVTMCPKIKAIEYHPNGSVKRVEVK